MKKATIIPVALLMLSLSACLNSGFKETKSGLKYKIYSDGKGPLAQKGNIIKMHFERRTTGDTTVISTYDQIPYYQLVDSVGPAYDPREIFMQLRKGDSAVILISGDSLLKRGTLPQDMTRKEQMILSLSVIEIFTADSLAQKDQMAERTKAQERQTAENERRIKQAEELRLPKAKEIEDYLAKNNITAQKAPLGTYVEIKEEGTGMKCEPGKTVKVRYTGKLFPSGKVFESNAGPDKEAYPVVIGNHGVIQGWEEGLQYFKKGGKGTLYIPFFLAYDTRPGPGGEPFENLMFDIFIEDVSDGQ